MGDPTTSNNDSNDDIIVANTHQQTLEWKYSTVWTSSFFEAHTLLHNTNNTYSPATTTTTQNNKNSGDESRNARSLSLFQTFALLLFFLFLPCTARTSLSLSLF